MACHRSSALFGPEKSPEMARIANDGLAEFVAKNPKHISSAGRPCADECGRRRAQGSPACAQKCANAIQLATNANGAPIDAKTFLADLRSD